MNWIRQYLLSVTVVTIICAIVKALIDHKNGSGKIIKLLTGIFVTIVVITPLGKLEFANIQDYIQNFTAEAEAAAATGTQYRQSELRRIIKSQTEAYILDKAASLGAELQVEVYVDEGNPPLPCAVTLDITKLAPYAREQLKQYIAHELGIPEEQQVWA